MHRFFPDAVFSYFEFCMRRIDPDVDIIMQVLQAVLSARPADTFVQSLLQQYQDRGGLSKKQLQGLYGKASKIATIPQARLATLEAIILRKHEKNRSAIPANEPLFKKDETTGKMLDDILLKFPQHKRVLFLKSKYDNNEVLQAAEISELQKFHKLLLK